MALYLFEFSIAGYFEALRSVQLDGTGADHLDAALLLLCTQRPYSAVHLNIIIQKSNGPVDHWSSRGNIK